MSLNRYAKFGQTVTQADGTTYQSGLPFVDFTYGGPIKFHQISETESGRPDLIAWKYWGDPSLYPYLAWYNNIRDPLTGFLATTTDPTTGAIVPNVIVIPTDVNQLLSQTIPFTYQGVGFPK